jgi:hypothetical protein
MNYTKIDYGAENKKYCDNVSGGFNKEIFLVGIFSGKEHELYALTPSHTKRLAIWLTGQVESYEKQFGTIDTNLPKPIESPIQPEDLKK